MATFRFPRSPQPAQREVEEAVFECALGIESPEAREAFLEHWFREDPEGLTRMRKLLEASAESASFFAEARERRVFVAREAVEGMELPPMVEPAGGSTLPIEGPGSRIGRYRIVRRIGEGGGGVVYEAEQEEPVRRKVALKIIRLGMNTEAVIARFEVERQALAMMDHRGISRVLDAGATEAGRPYFVMELVEGERITTWCDRNQMGMEGRIELFIQVCQAIQHAHQKGIVHRDIKPSNILVKSTDSGPVPKVIDFGIAKATGGDRGMGTQITERDHLIGTPAYMSPEQVDLRGIDIDTRTDIYSLGVVLYELLAGAAPFDEAILASAGISEMRRTLLEDDPPYPSQRLSGEELTKAAACRRLDASRLTAYLRGDLDAIVMKALEKNRNRRYPTANSLAADLRRFLSNQPVQARKPGRLYLIGKFVRRNRAACLSGVAVAVSLVAGLGASTWLYVREREAAAEQKRLALEAERARAEEARLREQAQARASISQVAGLLNRASAGRGGLSNSDFAGVEVLLSEGKAEEADALLLANPVDSIDPSPDAARVFRTLGHWNAMRGHWERALRCFRWLDQANRFDDPEGIMEGTDPMCLAALLAEFGSEKEYDAFRREMIERHVPVRSAFAAEHLLKVSLLRPLDTDCLDRLRQVAEMCASGTRSEFSGKDSLPQWDALALTTYYFRLGDFPKALEWGEKSLSFPGGRGDRLRSTHCLLAMAYHRMGEDGKRDQHLQEARALVPPTYGPTAPLRVDIWLDWSVSRIFLREAEAVCAEVAER